MDAKEYAEYEAAVKDFFGREGIENLSSGHPWCPECKTEWGDSEACPNCGQSRACCEESYFSWTPCDCCGRPLGGDRYHATGYHRPTNDVYEYEICVDCVYYAEYGQLDDMTMLDIEA